MKDATEFTRYFRFKSKEQQILLLSFIDESIKILKQLPQTSQLSVLNSLLIPWSKLVDEREAVHVYLRFWNLVKKEKSLSNYQDFLRQSRDILLKTNRLPTSIEDIASEKKHDKIIKLVEQARTWRQHEKEKKQFKTVDACIKKAFKFEDLKILSLIIQSLAPSE